MGIDYKIKWGDIRAPAMARAPASGARTATVPRDLGRETCLLFPRRVSSNACSQVRDGRGVAPDWPTLEFSCVF